MKLLDGKNIVITGASRGIGRGIALVFAKHGANIAFTYLSSKEAAIDLEQELLDNGCYKVKSYKSDASDFQSAQELVSDIILDFGAIDVLVNNAGITKDSLLMRMSEQDFDSVMSINMKSVFNMTKAVISPMLKAKSGSIINMSSVVGVKGNAGQANYAASKSAINGFTKSIALEIGSRNIRCNAIAPGFIETEMTDSLADETVKQWRKQIPLRRVGTTEDIAHTTLFLASDLSSYITGQVINVCGGMLT
ncbi:MAG: 3-oxoacyl-[acyl-carrier-protein] reductase [Flavobacteriales bacterium]|nr:3-oxoacyl-[acyl-carrier-protein] reductase [Flavobacteriales bacterium]|tara:strand:+ start:7060 stop:7809 length:750 start_codon:yes stop_codon:yes gene_type:complete